MQELFFVYSAIGSAPLGYFLLRLGFPKTQNLNSLKKAGYSFLLGLIVIIPSIIISQTVLETFLITTIIIFTILGLIFYARRIIANETDNVVLTIEARKREIPDAVLTTKEKEEKKVKIESVTEKEPASFDSNSIKVKGEIFKEKDSSVVNELRKNINPKNEKEVTLSKDNKSDEKEKVDLIKKLRDAAKGIKKNEKENNDEEMLETISNNEDDEEEY